MSDTKFALGLKPTNGKPYSAVIVDDSSMIRKLLRQMLLSEAFNVLADFDGGESLLEGYTQLPQKPEFAFVDVEMIGMNGIETVKAVRLIDPEIKVIMVTGITDQEVVRSLIQLGISGYIVKPINRDAVLERIAKILGRHDYFIEA